MQRERFQAFDYLRYLLRGVEVCYPWVDEVVLLLARPSQCPSWLDPTKVHVIYHDQFIPAQYLPTFNSCTIEMFLHALPIDAEYILYANDDFYPLRPLPFSAYFTSEGYPKFNLKNRQVKELSGFAETCREM